MRFIFWMFTIFGCGVLLLRGGYGENASTVFVLLAICVLSEIHKPEEGTIQAITWAKANCKWICWPLAWILFVK